MIGEQYPCAYEATDHVSVQAGIDVEVWMTTGGDDHYVGLTAAHARALAADLLEAAGEEKGTPEKETPGAVLEAVKDTLAALRSRAFLAEGHMEGYVAGEIRRAFDSLADALESRA